MIRFVHIQMSQGRAKSTTYGTSAAATTRAKSIGGCVHKVYYGARGLVRRMIRVGCYSPSMAFAGYSKKNRRSRRVARRAKRSR